MTKRSKVKLPDTPPVPKDPPCPDTCSVNRYVPEYVRARPGLVGTPRALPSGHAGRVSQRQNGKEGAQGTSAGAKSAVCAAASGKMRSPLAMHTKQMAAPPAAALQQGSFRKPRGSEPATQTGCSVGLGPRAVLCTVPSAQPTGAFLESPPSSREALSMPGEVLCRTGRPTETHTAPGCKGPTATEQQTCLHHTGPGDAPGRPASSSPAGLCTHPRAGAADTGPARLTWAG